MTVAAVDLVNHALTLLGQSTITALTDNDRNARTANQIYEQVRDGVVSAHPWYEAIRRSDLVRAFETVTVTSGVWSSGNTQITFEVSGTTLSGASYDVSSGNSVTIDSVSPTAYDATYRVTSVSGSTFVVEEDDDPGTYVSGGTMIRVPAFHFDHYYDLPDDFMRLHKPEDLQWDYRIEDDYLVTSETEVGIRYVKQMTDVDAMSPQLRGVIIAKLAMDMSLRLTGSDSTRDRMEKLYKDALMDAQFIDCSQEPVDQMIGSTWLNSHISGGQIWR